MFMEDVFVHVIDFKNTKVSEAVTVNSDGTYSIFINSRMDDSKQIDAYNHALKHIMNDDFSKTDVDAIEYEAHKEVKA